MEDYKSLNNAIRNREFYEITNCSVCISDLSDYFLTSRDGCNLQQCSDCGHVFTSPRFEEAKWNKFLKLPGNSRNKQYTDNRLKYGKALARKQTDSKDEWREHIKEKNLSVIRKLESIDNKLPKSVHDVGCGVGFFLMDARDKGIEVSGNDLNEYACERMQNDFQLDAKAETFVDLSLPENSINAVTMIDYIEHAYKPMIDIEEAFRVLEHGGLLYVDTFRIDSPDFENKGPQWNMLCWNHVQHFSTQTLSNLIENAGFRIIKVIAPNNRSFLKIIARKPYKLTAKKVKNYSWKESDGKINWQFFKEMNFKKLIWMASRLPGFISRRIFK